MSTTPNETVPTAWSVADETFFRAVADVFAPSFLLGASVLLGSYDAEPAHRATPAPASIDPARTEPAASSPLAA
jgi:hypothetical protein